MKNSTILAFTTVILIICSTIFAQIGEFYLGAAVAVFSVLFLIGGIIYKTIEEAADKIVNGCSDSPRNIRSLDGYQGDTKKPSPTSKSPSRYKTVTAINPAPAGTAVFSCSRCGNCVLYSDKECGKCGMNYEY